ncbi:hypothetical protein LTR94_032691, partial [Friedmanniomyces endolithicus]
DNQLVGDLVFISGLGRKAFRQNLTAQGDGLFEALDRLVTPQGAGQGGHGVGPDFGTDAGVDALIGHDLDLMIGQG